MSYLILLLTSYYASIQTLHHIEDVAHLQKMKIEQPGMYEMLINHEYDDINDLIFRDFLEGFSTGVEDCLLCEKQPYTPAEKREWLYLAFTEIIRGIRSEILPREFLPKPPDIPTEAGRPVNHPYNFGVTDNFFSYFNEQNRDELYAQTTALIVYTRADGSIIKDFKDIDDYSTAHIFAKNLCVRDENSPDFFKKGHPIYLTSQSCDASKCTFSSLEGQTLETLQTNLFGVVHNIFYFADPHVLQGLSGDLFERYLDSLPHFEGWKDFKGNTLSHPKSGRIPVIFSGMQDCDMTSPSL